MTTPEHSPLPWINEPDDAALGFGVVRDANGELIEIYGRHGMELRARIVTAVNSHAALLAAAKGLLRFNEELCADINVSKHYPSAEKARHAISAAEEPAPLWTE